MSSFLVLLSLACLSVLTWIASVPLPMQNRLLTSAESSMIRGTQNEGPWMTPDSGIFMYLNRYCRPIPDCQRDTCIGTGQGLLISECAGHLARAKYNVNDSSCQRASDSGGCVCLFTVLSSVCSTVEGRCRVVTDQHGNMTCQQYGPAPSVPVDTYAPDDCAADCPQLEDPI